MTTEKCPHCGMPWNEGVGEYECGSYPAGSSVVRATACTEIARLKAQLSQAERVVVPEQSAWAGGRVTPENSYVAWLRYLHAGMESWLELCDSNHEGAFRVYRAPVPASRVLKDGEVAVDADLLECLIQKLKGVSSLRGKVRCVPVIMDLLGQILQQFGSLRAQGKDTP